MNPGPKIVFDRQGRAYSIPAHLDIEPYQNSPCTYPGFAGEPRPAPAPPGSPCPGPGGAEVAVARHFDSESDFYHTDWQWGEVEFAGQHGLRGIYLCYHAHRSTESAIADFDPSCEMVKIEEEAGADDGVFAIVMD